MDRVPRLERDALVVDDDTFVSSAVAELLSDAGYDVQTASNGFSAVRLASEGRPLLVVLDLVLPERSGAEVLAELRANPATRHAAIVVVTGHAHLLTGAELAQADGVLTKPFDVDEFLSITQSAVRRALVRRAEVPPVAPVVQPGSPVGQRWPSSVHHSRGRH